MTHCSVPRACSPSFHIAVSGPRSAGVYHQPGKQQFRWLMYAIFYSSWMHTQYLFQPVGNLPGWVFGSHGNFDIFIIFALRQPEPVHATFGGNTIPPPTCLYSTTARDPKESGEHRYQQAMIIIRDNNLIRNDSMISRYDQD
jgi:hypothetical protein